jgi:hypothetical protein
MTTIFVCYIDEQFYTGPPYHAFMSAAAAEDFCNKTDGMAWIEVELTEES